MQRFPGEFVDQADRITLCRMGADPSQHDGTVLGRGAGHRGDQPGIVDQLAVVGQEGTVEPVAAHRRGQLHGARGVDAA